MKGVSLATTLVLTLLPMAVGAQQPVTEPPMPVIRATTHVVLVDVVVTDRKGNPVRGLTASDFTIEENGIRQKVSFLDTNDLDAGVASSSPTSSGSKLVPGYFTNRLESAVQHGPLNVLLIDALNTNAQDQAYSRQQMLDYAATQLKPGQRTAVYVLTNRLRRLQDFTTDQEALRSAIVNLHRHSLAETARSTPTTFTTGQAADAKIGQAASVANRKTLIASLQAFETERAATALEARIANTLAAFRALANALAGYRGRKNLIWVSSAFPFTLIPDNGQLGPGQDRGSDPTAPPPLPSENSVVALQQSLRRRFANEIRATAAALADVQTAIYPVDARGLIGGGPLTDASFNGLSMLGKIQSGDEYASNLSNSFGNLVSSQQNIRELAEQTGGRAFTNRNDIDRAVALAVNDGSASYTLGYYPRNKKWNGAFRKLKVTVTRTGLQVRHRTGYFARDTQRPANNAQAAGTEMGIAEIAFDSTFVLFDVQVTPKPVQAGKSTFPVLFRVDSKSVSWGDSGKHDVDIDLYVLALDSAGKVAANAGMTVAQSLDDSQYSQVTQGGLVVPVEISLAGGEYTMKLAVRDNRTGLLGSMTVPVKID